MKNIIKMSLFVFGIFIFQPTSISATSYNYLPNDVYIKQQEEKSALEYRLRSLESQIQNNPTISINTINQRILELQTQKETEKEYLKGTLAKNGAFSPEAWVSYSAKIDAKYDSQISSLEAQKTQYQQQATNQSDVNNQIAELQKQLKEIDAYYDKQKDAVVQKYQTTSSPKQETTIKDLYDWLETLSPDEWSEKLNLLKTSSPENFKKIEMLYRTYHPEFFTENKQTVKQSVKSVSTKQNTSKKEDVLPKKIESNFFDTGKITSSSTPTPTPVVKQPEPVKEKFSHKLFGFLKRLVFWK